MSAFRDESESRVKELERELREAREHLSMEKISNARDREALARFRERPRVQRNLILNVVLFGLSLAAVTAAFGHEWNTLGAGLLALVFASVASLVRAFAASLE